MSARATAIRDLEQRVGQEVGVSPWVEVTQQRIDTFAKAIDDFQWIHVDRERAKSSPFGGTIAHGFLTMSMMSVMAYQVCPAVEGTKTQVNYGFNRLRFITNCFTRLRFCHDDGRIALSYKGTIEKAPAGLQPWFRVRRRRSRDMRIVFGHWSALGFHDAEGVLCLDTGCVWGSQLTAVRLDARTPDTPVTPVCVECGSSGLSPGE